MYDALDEYEANRIPDHVWETLLAGHAWTTSLKHNQLTVLKKMELIRVGPSGKVSLTGQGAVYATMMVNPPL